jgi:peptide/nickel transport system ATP-binding protein
VPESDTIRERIAGTEAVDRADAPLLRIQNLRLEGRSGGIWQPIVHDVSFEVHRAEVVGLIGESGAGKSSVGLSALGYVRSGCRLAGGSVIFDGIDLFAESATVRSRLRGGRLAYVAQSAAASLNPAKRLLEQTIETVVMRRIFPRRAAIRRARDLYEALRLSPSVGERFPHQVSGGQLQRVMTAMALLAEPALVVFDEPTTALDVTTQVDVLAAIRDGLEYTRAAALYISHDLAVVAQMAHRTVVLKAGRVVEEANTRTMLSSPREAYTRSLWAVRTLTKPEIPRNEVILKVRNISAHYGAAKVLDQVSIEVPRGRILAVVGESGSGKTTLARVIAGLIVPTQGEVLLEDRTLASNVRQRSRDQLRAVQLIHQSADTALNPRRTVAEILGRPIELFTGNDRAARDSRIRELLDLTELPAACAHRLPSSLSGGQKQRVAIARALAALPSLIVCDEVTSALDQLVQEEVLKLLLRVQQELNVTYIFITHDIATVRAVADEVVVMYQGRMVEHGPKSVVLTPPHCGYTGKLLDSVPQLDPNWLSELAPRLGRTKVDTPHAK